MTNSKCMLIVTGPTGVGKTDFVLDLSKNVPCEIINIDIGQFYTPLSIGTAKPNWKNQSVPHHLFDIIDKPENITVVKYRKLVINKLQEIWKKNKIPILVGGSGFYIKSLLFPPQAKLKNNNNLSHNNNLWQTLNEIDPERAKKIDKNDIYRIKRALEIWEQTGKRPSEFIPLYDPPAKFIMIILTRDRQDLYQRIDKRVIEMIDEGWIKEVEDNRDWYNFFKEKKLIGYDDILKYLESYYDSNKELLIKDIQKKVRNYAKRQLTFFRMLDKNISNEDKFHDHEKTMWINLSSSDHSTNIKKVFEIINNFCNGLEKNDSRFK